MDLKLPAEVSLRLAREPIRWFGPSFHTTNKRKGHNLKICCCFTRARGPARTAPPLLKLLNLLKFSAPWEVTSWPEA